MKTRASARYSNQGGCMMHLYVRLWLALSHSHRVFQDRLLTLVWSHSHSDRLVLVALHFTIFIFKPLKWSNPF